MHHARSSRAPRLSIAERDRRWTITRDQMAFAFNIDLFNPGRRNGEIGVFADTVVITEKGARSLHAFPHELQRIGS